MRWPDGGLGTLVQLVVLDSVFSPTPGIGATRNGFGKRHNYVRYVIMIFMWRRKASLSGNFFKISIMVKVCHPDWEASIHLSIYLSSEIKGCHDV